jgi:tetratricopeptide (TPR) repeat protein
MHQIEAYFYRISEICGLGWLTNRIEGPIAAVEHYQRALEIEPNNLVLLGYVGALAADLNKPQLAIEIGEYVIERDPLCVPCQIALGGSYNQAGRYDNAIGAYENAILLQHAYFMPGYTVALIFGGHADAALDYMESEFVLPPGNLSGPRAVALRALGRDDEFDRVMEQMRDPASETPPMGLAQLYAMIGDVNAAFDIVIELPAEQLSMTVFDRGLRALRGHERWPVLAEKVGLWPNDPRDDVELDVRLRN